MAMVLIAAPKIISFSNDFYDIPSRAISVEPVYLSGIESRIRSASVKVIGANSGHGSGCYMQVGGRYFVFTAQHVVDTGTTYNVRTNSGDVAPGIVVYRDEKNDFAILSVQEIDGLRAIRLKYPRSSARRDNLVGTKVFYSGFPSGHDVISIRGEIAGFERNESKIIINAYGWMGSSGSCVFDGMGNMLGVVSALDVGVFEVPQLIEDIVWIIPYYELNFREVKRLILLEEN